MHHRRPILIPLGFACLGLLLHAGTLRADEQCRNPDELARRFAGQSDSRLTPEVQARTLRARQELETVQPGDTLGFTSAESGNTYTQLKVQEVVRNPDWQIEYIRSIGPQGQEVRIFATRAKPGSIQIQRTRSPPGPQIEDLATDLEYQVGQVFRQWKGGGNIPMQGWKIHVSASIETSSKIAETILPKLRENNIPHKVAASTEAYDKHLLRPGDSTNTQAGKFISIYPRSTDEARWLARMLDDALGARGFGPKDFISVPGEKALGVTGGVYARYGSFTSFNIYKTNGIGQVLGRDQKPLLFKGKPIDISRPLPLADLDELESFIKDFADVTDDIRGVSKPDWAPDIE